MLTFLAGAEVDVPQFRREWQASISIGAVSFAAPFVVAMGRRTGWPGWNRDQAEIGGLALSTTSLAVVYAVLVETGLNRSVIGKRIMSATFVTDILTVIGLSVLFITPNIWVDPVRRASRSRSSGGCPRIAPWFFGRYGDRVIEPEIKLVFAALFVLMYLGRKAEQPGGAARVRARPGDERPLRGAPHGAGTAARGRVRVPDAVLLHQGRAQRVAVRRVGEPRGAGAALFAKIAPKIGGVYPLARQYYSPDAAFTTLLMSTGLTFGTITSLYGLQAGIIDRTQFSFLVTVVVLSAVMPTAIAQRFFTPTGGEIAAAADPAERGSPSPPREPAADAV